ncbi:MULTISPECIES: hypothetical protein [unclassified Parafrankia]|uniref:hypothetical protein n=1 Tax=unclassified Parafrankia TaxID=2994368 RepID=UPI000DA4EBE2|nr:MULTISPECIES: hypothetical protein [unclassified Parafrankia]TCJ40458.1 hypothetical protein E0504_04760 [Parafrankia sp. BMG5.11]SQD99895.1 conserved hypothetical protein [Parafrankia sp. Ea1.12]
MTPISAPGRSARPGRPGFAAALFVAAGAAGLAGCDQVSEETRAAGATVVCSQINIQPSEIEQNPESARLVALLVRDLAPEDDIRAIADRVADDPTVLSPRAQLADWVDQRCGNAVGGSGGSGGSGGGGAGGGDSDGEDSEE